MQTDLKIMRTTVLDITSVIIIACNAKTQHPGIYCQVPSGIPSLSFRCIHLAITYHLGSSSSDNLCTYLQALRGGSWPLECFFFSRSRKKTWICYIVSPIWGREWLWTKFTHAHLLNKQNSSWFHSALLRFSYPFLFVLCFCFFVPKQIFLSAIASSLNPLRQISFY